MTSCTTTSTVAFVFPFVLPGYSDEFPAGNYKVIAEDELLANLSFAAYRRAATYVRVEGPDSTGRIELRPVDQQDLELVLARDRPRSNQQKNSEAALSPQEVN